MSTAGKGGGVGFTLGPAKSSQFAINPVTGLITWTNGLSAVRGFPPAPFTQPLSINCTDGITSQNTVVTLELKVTI